ncbi:hypothetical protein BB561_001454 [Smittium simulii]|uniref:SGNH hydrolase-type esterase domain-containing protein n=1 Tax=Smittium simulii TaxID=133385 RepID=A0A2T9YUJ5_9FUNG|nr:hypothetical protein BB561_001454 [Smittium simulii]
MLFNTIALLTFMAGAMSKNPHLVVFGDSLSDVGNRGSQNKIIPYFGNRLSDGPLWNEYVAHKNNFDIINFAHSGSASNNTNVSSFTGSWVGVPALADQVDKFINSMKTNVTRKDIKNDIAVIQIGANDFYYALKQMDKSAFKAVWYSNNVVNSIVQSSNKLMQFGFRKVLLVNVPDLKAIPGVKKAAGKFATGLDLFVTLTNLRLEQFSKAIAEKNFRGFKWLRILNYYDLTNIIMKNDDPKKTFGFVNYDVGCNQMIDKKTLSTCSSPDQYFFMDDSHPSARVHAITGTVANEIINNDNFKMDTKSVYDLYIKNNMFKVNTTFSPIFNNDSLDTGNVNVTEFNEKDFFKNKTRILREKTGRTSGASSNFVAPTAVVVYVALSALFML